VDRLKSRPEAERRAPASTSAWLLVSNRACSCRRRRYTRSVASRPGPFEGWSFLWQPPCSASSRCCSSCVRRLVHGTRRSELDMTGTVVLRRAVGAAARRARRGVLLSIVLMYGGLLLLMRVWLRHRRGDETAPRRRNLSPW